MYRSVMSWFWGINAQMQSDAITLCGHEAAEVRILQDYVFWRGNIISCDIDDRGLGVARSRGATAFNGDVRDAMSCSSRIGFVHLDWTGTLRDVETEAIAIASERILPGGVLATTWLGARESKNHRTTTEADYWSSVATKKNTDLDGNNELRKWSYLNVILTKLKKGRPHEWHRLFIDRYNSGHSPMMTICLVYIPDHWKSQRRQKILAEASHCHGDDVVGDYRWDPAGHTRLLKEEVLALCDRHGSEQEATHWISALFNLRPQTIAAWKAHRTMGTYKQAV